MHLPDLGLTSKLKNLNVLASPGHLYYDPSWIVLGVNNLCNLHCKMCDVGVANSKSNFYQNLMGSKPLNMPEELILKILGQVKEHFPKTKIGYAFTEPLIYPHLVSSLQRARDLGLQTSVTTNGLNLPQMADKLCQSGLNDLYLSLDGPPDVHNFIRGHKSSFQRALRGIHALMDHKERPNLSVYCVITEWNFNHLNAFIDEFTDLPLKQIGFMHTTFTTEAMARSHNVQYGDRYPATASNMTQIDVASIDLSMLTAEIDKVLAREDSRIIFSPHLVGKEQLVQFYHEPEKLLGKRCNDVFSNIMVKSNGDVIPAHGRCYNLKIGNIYETNLKEIWNSQVIASFRKTLVKEGGLLPACARCCSAF